jgi:Helix-turn-helix domain
VSVKVMRAVWDGFPYGGALRLAMLALADYARDDGTKVYPSYGTLAKKLRCDRRQAIRSVTRLEKMGYIVPAPNDNKYGGKPGSGSTRKFSIAMHMLTGDKNVTGPRTKTGDKKDTGVGTETGVKNVTGVRRDTGDISDAEGCQKRQRRVTKMAERGDDNITQSVSEPSIEPPVSGGAGTAQLRRAPHSLPSHLPKEWENYATTTRPDIDVQNTFTKFVAHHQAGEPRDWFPVWQGWVVREFKPVAGVNGSQATSVQRADGKRVAIIPGWWRSPEGIDKQGGLMGMRGNGNEGYDSYKDRIFAEIRRCEQSTRAGAAA